MAEVTFSPVVAQDIEELAFSARPDDFVECVAGGFMGVAEAAERSLSMAGLAASVRFDGRLAAIIGVNPQQCAALAPSEANLWLLTSTVVDEHPMTFFRVAKELLGSLRGQYASLWTLTHDQHARALRFLQAMGFIASAPMAHGPHGEMFRFVATKGR